MSRKRRAVLVGVCLFIPWLLTGGCVAVRSTYRFVDDFNQDYRPWLRVEVASNYRTYGVPFLWTFTDDVPPYHATFIYYTQSIVEGAVIEVEKITIRYGDGSEVDLAGQFRKEVIPVSAEMSYIEDHVRQEKKCLRASWTIRDCITQRGPFAFIVVVWLRRGTQVLERVEATLKCEPFGETHTFATWYWWIVSQA
jgi:hypothetical protein